MKKVYQFDKFLHMDIFQKEINYFIAIAESLNVSKAAEQLGIQQSGLSRALHRLETDLGHELFHRKSHGMSLTPTGQQFLASLQETKKKWDEHIRDLIQSSENPIGTIKIGMHSSLGQSYLPKLIHLLTESFPQIEIETHLIPSLLATRNVTNGDLDFAIVASPLKQPELIVKNIDEDELALFQTLGSKNYKYILFNPETQMSNTILNKMTGLKKIAIKDYDMIAKAAQHRDYVALLPKLVAQSYPHLQQISPSLARNKVSLIVHKNKLSSQSYRKIWNKILESQL